MKLFKKPPIKSEEELKPMLNKIRQQNISRKEEWLMIAMALKTFLPYVIGVFIIIWGVALIVSWLL